jgi:hypothetical protein
MLTKSERQERNTERKRLYRSENRAILNERQRLYAALNPEKAAASQRKRKYGITQEQFDDMRSSQNNACAICGSEEPKGVGTFHVDHCHATQIVRGLLCHHCNLGLGHFKDNPAALRTAATYIEGHAR